jgi:hypothetical protein
MNSQYTKHKTTSNMSLKIAPEAFEAPKQNKNQRNSK